MEEKKDEVKRPETDEKKKTEKKLGKTSLSFQWIRKTCLQ